MMNGQGKEGSWKRSLATGALTISIATVVLLTGSRNYTLLIDSGFWELIFYGGILALILGSMKLLDGVFRFEKMRNATVTSTDGTVAASLEVKNRPLGYVLVFIGGATFILSPLIFFGFIIAGGGDLGTITGLVAIVILAVAFIVTGSYLLTNKTTSLIKSAGIGIATAVLIVAALAFSFFLAGWLS